MISSLRMSKTPSVCRFKEEDRFSVCDLTLRRSGEFACDLVDCALFCNMDADVLLKDL